MSIQSAILLRSNETRFRVKKDPSFKLESDFFVTLYSEISSVGFNDGKRPTTNQESIQIINKFIKNAKFIIENVKSEEAINQAEKEIFWASEFLPVMMSEKEITDVLNYLLENNKDFKIGDIMKYFKEHFPSLYDSKLLSSIASKMLGG